MHGVVVEIPPTTPPSLIPPVTMGAIPFWICEVIPCATVATIPNWIPPSSIP